MEQCLRKLFVNGTTFYMKLELFVFKFTYMNKKIGKKDFSSIYHFFIRKRAVCPRKADTFFENLKNVFSSQLVYHTRQVEVKAGTKKGYQTHFARLYFHSYDHLKSFTNMSAWQLITLVMEPYRWQETKTHDDPSVAFIKYQQNMID